MAPPSLSTPQPQGASRQAPGFYARYAAYKGYATPGLKKKHIARLDREIWHPGEFAPDMACLEIGCGMGQVLAYLHKKGVRTISGIDHDPLLASVQPPEVADRFQCRDVWELLADPAVPAFDRILMLDVIEHFPAEEGKALIAAMKGKLTARGRVLLRFPNAGSPWGLSYQHGDLTHRGAFNANSMRQLADAAGFDAVRIFPQRQGTLRRRMTDAALHRLLSWALLTAPEFWEANLYALLAPRPEG